MFESALFVTLSRHNIGFGDEVQEFINDITAFSFIQYSPDSPNPEYLRKPIEQINKAPHSSEI